MSEMIGIIFAVIISVGIPLIALLYAICKRCYIPFIFGVLAFVVSQMFLRLPLMAYVAQHSAVYSMFSVTRPVLFAIVIGLSAGVFEEIARFVAMRYLLKQRNWRAGFLFGAGHGGIEAFLLVGISAITLLFSPVIGSGSLYMIGGVERFFAIVLHIGLSIIVLQAVIQRKIIYLVLAILIHGFVDALVGILPIYLSQDATLITVEVVLAITAIAVFGYSLWIKRKGVLQ